MTHTNSEHGLWPSAARGSAEGGYRRRGADGGARDFGIWETPLPGVFRGRVECVFGESILGGYGGVRGIPWGLGYACLLG